MNANLENNHPATEKAPALITGLETDTKLRMLVMQFVAKCPAGEHHAHCPFRTLSGLSYGSLDTLLKDMSREALLELFELERECRSGN
jgi:hypothetical protein